MSFTGYKLGFLPLFASVNAEAGRNVYVQKYGGRSTDLSL